MQPTLEQWLERGKKEPKGFYRMPRRKPERAKQDRQYNARVKVWLQLPENRWCGVWLAQRGLTWLNVTPDGWAAWNDDGVTAQARCPRSTQCHHTNKRTGPRLLDEKFWLGVSDEGHLWINSNFKQAREIGVLL